MPRRKRPSYPVAQPYAPPPGIPMARPLPPGANPIIAPLFSRQAVSNLLRTVLVVAGIVLACVAGGWYFFQGPGAAVIKNLAARKPAADADQPAVAENAKDTPAPSVSPPPEQPKAAPAPKPPEKPKTEPTPTPAPLPEKPAEKPAASPPEPPPGLAFEKDILPIFQAKCVNCHNEDKKRGGLDVTSLAALLKGGESGPGVVAGALDRSTLWGAVNTNQMPPTPSKLTPAEKKAIQDWILMGARGSATAAKP